MESRWEGRSEWACRAAWGGLPGGEWWLMIYNQYILKQSNKYISYMDLNNMNNKIKYTNGFMMK